LKPSNAIKLSGNKKKIMKFSEALKKYQHDIVVKVVKQLDSARIACQHAGLSDEEFSIGKA
jgi:hypothetical protein